MYKLIVKDLIAQYNSLMQFKHLGINIFYPLTYEKVFYHARLMLFSDGGRVWGHVQLFYVAGILLYDLQYI